MSTQLLQEVSEWKLEAKLESSVRYFYHTRAVDLLAQGKRSYVIGRKGTGKTAICEHLMATTAPGFFAEKLTFKNFPFNKLYAQDDQGFTSPNQYITVWKYLIYSTVCKMLAKNPAVDTETRIELNRQFNFDISHALPSAIEKLAEMKFDFKILGTGVGFQATKRPKHQADLTTSEKVDFLEHYIYNRLGAETYLIMFDELDEDYKDVVTPEKYRKYTDLLTSLFKAVQDIRSKFNKFKIFPVVFLRDDIYDILQDPDKTKWLDYKIELSWTRANIQNLLAFRISRAIDTEQAPMLFARAWARLYAGGGVPYGHQQQRRMPAFDYITRSTQGRPRDYIRYLQVCAEQAMEKGERGISPAIVISGDKSFSNYLRSELVDEIHGIVPEIDKVFDLFSRLRKQTLSISDFQTLHGDLVKSGELPQRDVKFILQILFHFSVIGNVPRQKNHSVFRYENKDAELNFSESICVHRGLFKALQIL